MNRKISLGIAISLIAIACAVTFVVTMTVSLNLYNEKIAGVQHREEINTRIQEIDAFVRNYSLYEISDADIKTGIYGGYLDGVADKYSDYYTTNEYYYESMLRKGTLVGLGFETQNDGGYPKVSVVYDNSPASEAGITVGDVISKIGGQNVLEIGYETAEAQLKFGDEGTKTTFTLRHNETETDYSLTRKSFEILSVKASILDNGILYIKFTDINDVTGRQLTEALKEFETAEVKGYIFDLRNCESGNYSSAAGILNPFVGKSTIASAVYRNNSYMVVGETTDESYTALPISVLINEKTGGSAELIALTLRDMNGAKLVGVATMGYGTLQEVRTFSDGTAVEISVATILPAKTESLYNEIGIKPEFIVEYTGVTEADPTNYAASYDVQYKKAVEVILPSADITEE